MQQHRQMWEVLETEVLVVGGGFGGLWAALRAAESGAGVMLVDKSFAGKSGHSYFAGGAMMVMLPEDDPEAHLRDIVHGNDWIVDQEMVAAIFAESCDRLKDLEAFGIAFRKQGSEYVSTRARGTHCVKNLWPAHATAADEVTVLRKLALDRGVQVVDHVYVYDLLREAGGAVCGAVGIGVKTGLNYLLQARSVVLATNSGSYRGHHLACELQGTGPFMAYDAGATLKNPEFHYVNIRPAKHEIEGSGILPAIGAKWVNAKGVHYMAEYDPELKDRSQVSKIVRAAALEVMKGNGPISLDVAAMTEAEREKFRTLQVSHGWMPILFEKCRREEGYDPLCDNIEWQPAYEANKLGIACDVDGGTGIEGLFAAGMARDLGINPFTGWSIAACTWSGYRAGQSAARAASGTPRRRPAFDAAMQSRSGFLEPLTRPDEKSIAPDALVHELQKILYPVGVLIIMHEARLRAALEQVLALKSDQLPRVRARDVRELIKARETATMLFSAEITLKAAMMRRESRENIFYREDYPHPDNRDWLKWIVVRKGPAREPVFETRPIPFDRYPIKP